MNTNADMGHDTIKTEMVKMHLVNTNSACKLLVEYTDDESEAEVTLDKRVTTPLSDQETKSETLSLAERSFPSRGHFDSHSGSGIDNKSFSSQGTVSQRIVRVLVDVKYV